eukprot:g2054.t1
MPNHDPVSESSSDDEDLGSLLAKKIKESPKKKPKIKQEPTDSSNVSSSTTVSATSSAPTSAPVNPSSDSKFQWTDGSIQKRRETKKDKINELERECLLTNRRYQLDEVWEKFRYNEDEPAKNMVVSGILVRWWYAFEWPVLDEVKKEEENGVETNEKKKKRKSPPGKNILQAPDNYTMLSGYPGVLVGVEGNAIGDLIDTRWGPLVPSRAALLKRPMKDLHELWIKALVGQMKALKEAEGENANPDIVEQLRAELAVAKAFNIKKAETQYGRRLKRIQKDIDKLSKSRKRKKPTK